MPKENTKRTLAFLTLWIAVALHVVSVRTDYWIEQASPVRKLSSMDKSEVVLWKSLYQACLRMPPKYKTICVPLETIGFENGKLSFYSVSKHVFRVRGLMVANVGDLNSAPGVPFPSCVIKLYHNLDGGWILDKQYP